MKALGIVAVLALALASRAQAQQTQCLPTGDGGMQCQTIPDAAANLRNLEDQTRGSSSGSSGPSMSETLNSGAYPAMCSGPPITNLGCYARVNAERKEVGALMANGQCDDAMKRALREGDFKMAATVKELCSVPSAVAGGMR